MPKVTDSYRRKKQLEIAHAARKVFEDKGYTNTTMNDVMFAANIARGTLYSYFDSIEQVFLEVLALVDKQLLTIEEDNGMKFAERLETLISRRVLDLIRQPSLVQARAEYFFSLEDATIFKQRHNKTIEEITSFLQKGVVAGEFAPEKNVKFIAHYMLSFIDGLMLNTSQLDEVSNCVEEQLEIFHSSLNALLGLEKKAKK